MIRKITKEDIDTINKLALEYDLDFINHYSLENYLDNEVYLINVYEENNDIKGFIITNVLYEDIEILLIYVKPDSRKNGIAKLLISDLANYSKDRILLEVSIENLPALNLYNSLGFNKLSTRKGYYKGIDAIVMEKRLK